MKIDITKLQEIEFSGIAVDKPLKGRLVNLEIGIDNIFYKSFAIFTNDISPDGHPIVGQKGFFEFFTVQFDYLGRRGYLK